MNKSRRKRISDIITKLNNIASEMEEIKDEEEEAYGNLPDGLKLADKGIKMEDNVSTLDGCCIDIESMVSALNEIS